MNTWYEDLMQFGFGYYFMGYLVQVMLYNPNKASSISINLHHFHACVRANTLIDGTRGTCCAKKD